MVPNTQARGLVGEEEQPPCSTGDGVNVRSMRVAAMELAAQLDWLPGASSDTFAARCRKLAATLESLFAGVDAAFAKAPGSEDLLWLRDNEQQLSSAASVLATDLGPLT